MADSAFESSAVDGAPANIPIPVMGGDVMNLPPIDVSGAPRLPVEALTPAEMIRQIRNIFIYVAQETEGGNDKEVWIMGMNYKKTAHFVSSLLRQGKPIPKTIYDALEYFWELESGRKRIGEVLGVPPEERNFPLFPTIDDDEWLLESRKELMTAKRIDDATAKKLGVERGRETVKEIIIAALSRERPLRADEKETIANMARNITSADVIKIFIPLANKNPWVWVHILNNLALADGTRDLNGFAQINFAPAIDQLLEAAKEDMGIASKLVGILSNPYTDKVISQISFYNDIIEPIIDAPAVDNPNMMGALIENGCYFGLEEVCELASNIDSMEDSKARQRILSSIKNYLITILRSNLAQLTEKGEKPSLVAGGRLQLVRDIVDIFKRHKIGLYRINNLLGGIRAFMEGLDMDGY